MSSRRLILPVACLVLAACSNDAAAPDPVTLAGTWNATVLEFVSVAPPVRRVDVIPLGGNLRVQLAQGGTFTMALTLPGEPVWNLGGTWNASVDVFTFNFTSGMNATQQYDMTHSGNTLTLRNASGEYAFSGGEPEDARVNLTLVRQ